MNPTSINVDKTSESAGYPPYNPWQSYLIEASAGSGKTWQLSRRFLALVVAGADPSSILTVTFTKKAAAEMRERIVHDAISLGNGSKEFADFISDIRKWHVKSGGHESVKIRTAEEACRLIIQKTQTLKITTIDALFIQWVQRFPIETSVTINDSTLKSPWNLLSNLAQTRLNTAAWGDVLAMNSDDDANRELMQYISQNAPNGNISGLQAVIDPLTKSDTFLWYIRMLGRENSLKLYDVKDDDTSPEEFIECHRKLFETVIQLVSNKDKSVEGLRHVATPNMSGLITAGILTKGTGNLSGTCFGSAATKQNSAFISLKEKLSARLANIKLSDLNKTATLVWSLYNARTSAAHRRKVSDSSGTFIDAAKGASVLACDDQMVGGRAMAWSTVRHLMLDEFQDTSRLQWLIFEKIALELLAGQIIDTESGPSPSVFIVGDKKQSIYRFREAAPEVLDIARKNLVRFGLVSQGMNASFRSSSIVLDYVNLVFEDGTNISDFPAHEASPLLLKSDPTRSTYGTVAVYNVCEQQIGRNKLPLTPVEAEAEAVASHIRDCLDGTIVIRVFDSALKGWRAPKCSDFVIVYPTSTHSQKFEEALRSCNIPSRREEAKGFFGRCEIMDLNALVTWLTWPADTVALCTVLRSPLVGLTDMELQKLLQNHPTDLFAVGLKTTFPVEWQLLSDLKGSHLQETLAGLVAMLLTKYGVGDRYERAFGPMEGPLAKANVLKWFDLVRGSSGEEAVATHSWNLALEEASEEDETGNAALASNSVTMMSIHKSKGLEFPCVVVTGTASDWHKNESGWIKDTRPGEEGMWYIGSKPQRPEGSLDFDQVLALNERESRSEKARVLYVSLTRASHHLVITGSRKTPGTKAKLTPTFLDLLKQASEKLDNVIKIPIGEAGNMFTRGTTPALSESTVAVRDPDYLRHKVKSLSLEAVKILTPSAAAKKNPAPGEFAAPHARSSAVSQRLPDGAGKAFGTLVHKLLENHLKKITWSPSRLTGLLKINVSEALSDEVLAKVLALAEGDVALVLASDTWKKLLAGAKSIHAEVPMALIRSGTLINAKADLIILYSDGSLKVVDYKTIPVDISVDVERDVEGNRQGQDETLTAFCHDHGYTQQVKDYCDMAKKAFAAENVSGHVLFTNPMHLVTLC